MTVSFETFVDQIREAISDCGRPVGTFEALFSCQIASLELDSLEFVELGFVVRGNAPSFELPPLFDEDPGALTLGELHHLMVASMERDV